MSEVKVNKISPRSGTEVTLGDSGDTFTIPSGATINNQGTATNFGATGSASWTTTVKTSGFTAVAGEGYFVDTSSGAVSVNLPAGTAGAVVAFKDYLGTFDTNGLTLVQNGSDKIGGLTDNVILSEEGIAVTLVFIDSTQGWLVTDSGLQSEAQAPKYIAATGGTVTTVCTNFKVHTFTGPGTFAVSCAGNPSGSNTLDYLVVAGGGSGGTTNGAAGAGGGGGGAGGYRESSGAASGCYTVSPLGCSVSALPVAATSYPVTVGAGGATEPFPQPGNSASNPGSNSVFSGTTTITSTGGGGGTNFATTATGGSGGGAGNDGCNVTAGGAGNTPPVSPAQGNPGGSTQAQGTFYGSGGGGGALAAGSNGTPNDAGAGGGGATSSINGTPTARAGGGGGGTYGGGPGNGGPSEAAGGAGGGGSGSSHPKGDNATAGTANTGGGGGGTGANPNGASNYSGKAGGSGIVIIRYQFQN
jgi:hypothetical protein